jgi:predicted chitinase/LysM repeat protein
MRFEDLVARPDVDQDDGSEEIIRNFADFACDRIGLKDKPTIKLIRDPKHAVKRKSFGGYMGGNIEIMIGNRHVMDVMRTLAHELVHYKQDSDGVLTPDSGRDGSEHENEANAKAAVVMRLWGKMNPDLFDRAAILAEAWSAKYKRSINCNSPKGFSQRAHCQGRKKNEDVDESLASTLAGAALATGLAFGSGAQAKQLPNHGYPGPVEIVQTIKPGDTVFSIAKKYGVTAQELAKFNNLDKNFTIKVGDEIAIPKKGAARTATPSKQPVAKATPTAKPAAQPKQSATPRPTVSPSKTMTGTMHEAVLKSEALKAGITGVELAAFLAQCNHETLNFTHVVEIGGSLDFRKYDPKFAPKKARVLGNIRPGDGARYKGRGYIQLTGRYNYRRAGQALGLPLEQKPELVERPDIAAKVAVWFWKQRVQPKVDNYNDVRAVTIPINPGLNGLADRRQTFVDYKDFYKFTPKNI